MYMSRLSSEYDVICLLTQHFGRRYLMKGAPHTNLTCMYMYMWSNRTSVVGFGFANRATFFDSQ